MLRKHLGLSTKNGRKRKLQARAVPMTMQVTAKAPQALLEKSVPRIDMGKLIDLGANTEICQDINNLPTPPGVCRMR